MNLKKMRNTSRTDLPYPLNGSDTLTDISMPIVAAFLKDVGVEPESL